MKHLTIIALLIIILAIPASAASVSVGVGSPWPYCIHCPACPSAGVPCPGQPPYYYYPGQIYSYDDYYRFGGRANRDGIMDFRPSNPFPPYLGIDAGRQWFAQPLS